jgi:hypothetical protein
MTESDKRHRAFPFKAGRQIGQANSLHPNERDSHIQCRGRDAYPR